MNSDIMGVSKRYERERRSSIKHVRKSRWSRRSRERLMEEESVGREELVVVGWSCKNERLGVFSEASLSLNPAVLPLLTPHHSPRHLNTSPWIPSQGKFAQNCVLEA
jgi:hypothetical protein